LDRWIVFETVVGDEWRWSGAIHGALFSAAHRDASIYLRRERDRDRRILYSGPVPENRATFDRGRLSPRQLDNPRLDIPEN